MPAGVCTHGRTPETSRDSRQEVATHIFFRDPLDRQDAHQVSHLAREAAAMLHKRLDLLDEGHHSELHRRDGHSRVRRESLRRIHAPPPVPGHHLLPRPRPRAQHVDRDMRAEHEVDVLVAVASHHLQSLLHRTPATPKWHLRQDCPTVPRVSSIRKAALGWRGGGRAFGWRGRGEKNHTSMVSSSRTGTSTGPKCRIRTKPLCRLDISAWSLSTSECLPG